jgi:nucleoside-diphosphate-sugar epimerase
MSSDKALIIGCGYLGRRLAQLLNNDRVRVAATTRTDANWPDLEKLGVNVSLFDLLSANASIPDLPCTDPDAVDVFFMVPTSIVHKALEVGDTFDRLLDALKLLPIGRAFLVSSTGIFPRADEQTVDAEFTSVGTDPRSRRIAQIERRWLEMGEKFFVSRLAGLYGPGRIIGRQKLRLGEVIPGDPEGWLNLIHVEDAARFIDASNRSKETQRIEIASDAQPVRRREYYNFVAQELSLPRLANFGSQTSDEKVGSYRCNPSSSMRRTGWSPLQLSFRDGIRAILKAEHAGS